MSFQLFLDYIERSSKSPFRHFDLPVIDSPNNANPRVKHLQTFVSLLRVLFYVPFSKSVVIFGSRNFAFFYSTLFLLSCRCFGKQCTVRFFGGRPMLALLNQNSLIHKIVLTMFRTANKVLVQTEFGAKEFPKFLQKKIEVFFGYRSRAPEKLERLFHNPGIIRFVYGGQVSRTKGIDVLLSAFSELNKLSKQRNSIELHLYGVGTQEIVHRLRDVDRVFYHGVVDNLSLRHCLSSYSVLVFPSVYNNEGHPGIIIEALMAGLPIIATDPPVIREILKHESNALLVRSGDVKALAKAMHRLACDENLRLSLSRAALASSKRFDKNLVLPNLAATLGF